MMLIPGWLSPGLGQPGLVLENSERSVPGGRGRPCEGGALRSRHKPGSAWTGGREVILIPGTLSPIPGA